MHFVARSSPQWSEPHTPLSSEPRLVPDLNWWMALGLTVWPMASTTAINRPSRPQAQALQLQRRSRPAFAWSRLIHRLAALLVLPCHRLLRGRSSRFSTMVLARLNCRLPRRTIRSLQRRTRSITQSRLAVSPRPIPSCASRRETDSGPVSDPKDALWLAYQGR